MLGASGSTGACEPEGDVGFLSELEPIQSVASPDSVAHADLVAFKDGVIRAEIESTFDEPVPAEIVFTIRQPDFPDRVHAEFMQLGPCSKSYYFPAPIQPEACEEHPLGGGRIEPSFAGRSLEELGLVPFAGRPYRVDAEIRLTDPAQTDANPDNDRATSNFRQVKETLLSVVYTQVECRRGDACAGGADDYGAIDPPEYATAVEFSELHTKAMFPVAPSPLGGYFSKECRLRDGTPCRTRGDSRKCTDPTKFASCAGIIKDMRESWRVASIVDPAFDRVVVMIPDGYFSYHGSKNPEGLWWPSQGTSEVVLVRSPFPAGTSTNPATKGKHIPVMPHELVHSYDPACLAAVFAGNSEIICHRATSPLDGYFVGCDHRFPDCAIPGDPVVALAHDNLMRREGFSEPPDAWIDLPAYQDALLAQLKVSPDPVILGVSGTWHIDGTVVIEAMDEHPNGKASRVLLPGDGAIVFLDDGGAVLQSTSIQLPPCRGIDETTEGGILESDNCNVGIRLLYPPETAAVQFRAHDKVLLTVDPLSMTLRSMIELLPDPAFERNATERRKALLEKIDAFEGMVAKKKFRPAIEKLEKDIRDKVEKWILDEYDAGPDLPIPKADVLALINRTIERLRVREGRRAPPPR